MTQLPYTTDNSRLAVCLELAGQKRLGVQNRYTPERLTQIGCATVMDALRASKPGKVIYYFERTPELPALLAAFTEQTRKNESREAGEAPDELSAEDLVRIACATLALAKEYSGLWKLGNTVLANEGKVTNTVTESMRVTKEMLARGPVVMDGKEYNEGDSIPISGVVTIGPSSVIGIKVPSQLRD